jgi:hypothetical protein
MEDAQKPNPEQTLFNESSFYELDKEKQAGILFEQYKLYVEMMDKVSERRSTANSFYLTANSLLVTALAGILAVERDIDRPIWLIVPAIAGVLLALNWYRIIQSYRNLNSHKFKIIHLLESRLPARLYDAEWVVAEQGKTDSYIPLSHIESWIPLIFMGLYVIVAAIALFTRI